MIKIKFTKMDGNYYFDTDNMTILNPDNSSYDMLYCERRVDSKLVKKYFSSENYVVDERNGLLVVYDRCSNRYNENYCIHKNFKNQ